MISNIVATSQLIVADSFLRPSQPSSYQDHLEAAVNWLKRAHDSSEDDGVSYGYCLRGPSIRRITEVGWKPSYVETSGYILETFFDLAHALQDDDCRKRAEAIARWLVSVQNADGSFSNDHFGKDQGIVFDTGQVLFGLTRAYVETGDEYFLNSAMLAGRWLAESMDQDGAWRRNTHLNCVHTYNSRVAWAMLELDKANANKAIEDAARRNLKWAVEQYTDGFYRQCAFEPGLPPFTHTMAYAIRGIYEGGLLLDDKAMVDTAINSANRMQDFVRADGHIPSRIDIQGNPQSHSCCLTGNCQLAIIWSKIDKEFEYPEMRESASKALGYVKSVQNIATQDDNIRGAIKGSHPIWGKYAPLCYPNWATKFFIDAMLLEQPS